MPLNLGVEDDLDWELCRSHRKKSFARFIIIRQLVNSVSICLAKTIRLSITIMICINSTISVIFDLFLLVYVAFSVNIVF